MPDEIHELVVIDTASEKLAARDISDEEAEELTDNRHVITPNRGRRRRSARVMRNRRMLIGRTDGGRALTLVVERTIEPSSWLVITGWNSSKRERKMLAKKG